MKKPICTVWVGPPGQPWPPKVRIEFTDTADGSKVFFEDVEQLLVQAVILGTSAVPLPPLVPTRLEITVCRTRSSEVNHAFLVYLAECGVSVQINDSTRPASFLGGARYEVDPRDMKDCVALTFTAERALRGEGIDGLHWRLADAIQRLDAAYSQRLMLGPVHAQRIISEATSLAAHVFSGRLKSPVLEASAAPVAAEENDDVITKNERLLSPEDSVPFYLVMESSDRLGIDGFAVMRIESPSALSISFVLVDMTGRDPSSLVFTSEQIKASPVVTWSFAEAMAALSAREAEREIHQRVLDAIAQHRRKVAV